MCETEIFYLYAILPKPWSGCEIYEKDKWKFMSLGDKIALTQFKLRFFVIEKAGNWPVIALKNKQDVNIGIIVRHFLNS